MDFTTPLPDWSSMPRDILGLIVDKLVDVSDRVRMAAVCKPWLSIIGRDRDAKCFHSGQNQLPMLLIPTDDNGETPRSLFSVPDGRVLPGTRLHVPYNQRCSGSSHGWLIFAGEDLGLTLFNPFSGATISLPPVTRVPTEEENGEGFYRHDYEIPKVVLSKDPSLAPDDYEVLVLYGFDVKELALFRAGDKKRSWIYARQGDWYSDIFSFQDVTCFKGRFYAVNNKALVSLEPDESGIELKPIVRRRNRSEHSYVVGCGDALMWIERYYVQSEYAGDDYEPEYSIEAQRDHGKEKTNYDVYDHEIATGYFDIEGHVYGYISDYHHLTLSFRVYRLDDDVDGEIEAVELDDLDGHAIFLGDNHACCVSASDFPGCRPDCIYYMDDWLHMGFQPLGPIDIGVFSLEDQCTRLLYVLRRSQWDLPSPIWIVPQAKTINTISISP